MKLIIVSGRSGSGKSTALHVLEDTGYYCIDNLPIGLMQELTQEALAHSHNGPQKIAVSIDARNFSRELKDFPDIMERLSREGVETETIYLDANAETLLTRFHGTRRKHPLSSKTVSLREAIDQEKSILDPIASNATLFIDTSQLTIYQLRDQIKLRVLGHQGQELALLFQSFGFKHGVPPDSDFVFDVRCLPNPYWDPALRGSSGQDQPVIDFMESHPQTGEMLADITAYLEKWLPHFQTSNRTYLTISIGCTGGQHRSVYLCEKLKAHFASRYENVQHRHQEFSNWAP